MEPESQEERIVKALEAIAGVLVQIAEEGITIYQTELGTENQN